MQCAVIRKVTYVWFACDRLYRSIWNLVLSLLLCDCLCVLVCHIAAIHGHGLGMSCG